MVTDMSEITIKDVALAAGVSVGTASMAINEKKGVSTQTKKKVLTIAKELGYEPNRYAKALSLKKTHTIGLIVTDIENPFFGQIISYIQQYLEVYGYDLMLGISGGSVTKEKMIISKFISLRVDGVISVPSHKPVDDFSHFAELQDRNIPLCFITSYYHGIQAPCVMTDLKMGSYMLTKDLLKKGHKSIVYIVANLSLPLAELRVDGYRSAFLETGISFDHNWVVTVEDASFDGGYNATKKLIKNFLPDAIFAMNDIMALGAYKCLLEHGYKIPSDISLAGYDDLIYTTLIETPLTTVQQPIQKMSEKSVDILVNQIVVDNFIKEKILLEPKLIIRESTMSKI